MCSSDRKPSPISSLLRHTHFYCSILYHTLLHHLSNPLYPSPIPPGPLPRFSPSPVPAIFSQLSFLIYPSPQSTTYPRTYRTSRYQQRHEQVWTSFILVFIDVLAAIHIKLSNVLRKQHVHLKMSPFVTSQI